MLKSSPTDLVRHVIYMIHTHMCIFAYMSACTDTYVHTHIHTNIYKKITIEVYDNICEYSMYMLFSSMSQSVGDGPSIPIRWTSLLI